MAKVQPKTSTVKAPASAKPGTKDETAAKVKITKVKHPSLVGPNDEEGKPTELKIKEVPADFDPKVHMHLKKTDFESDGAFLRFRAAQLRAQAAKFETEAELADKLGSRADRQKAKKLIAMQSKMEELRKQLADAGVDIDALTADA